MPSTLTTPTKNRDALPDSLRGFALMGILIMNAPPASGYVARLSLPDQAIPQIDGAMSPLQKYLKPVAFWGIMLGIPLNIPPALAMMGPSQPHSLNSLINALCYWSGVPILAAAWVSIFLLLWQRNPHNGLFQRLGACGRMALTNYITQTAIAIVVFIVLGYSITVTASWLLVYIVAVWILQMIWSPIWLKYVNYGPLEFLWRWATYGQKPVFRRLPQTIT